MSQRPEGTARLNIVIADADPRVVDRIASILREERHAVFHAWDARSAIQLATEYPDVDLLLTNTLVIDAPGIELVHRLRARMPTFPIIYLASTTLSTPEIEAQLPRDIPIIREPYPADELLGLIRPLSIMKAAERVR